MTDGFQVPLIIRGEVIDGEDEFAGRRNDARFFGPDVAEFRLRLPLQSPRLMADLYEIGFDAIADFLGRLGERLDFENNRYLRDAYELSRLTSGLSDSILIAQYRNLPNLFARERIFEAAENSVGLAYLEDWVEQEMAPESPTSVRVRAFGSRAVHIIAGNSPIVSALTVIRNAITRSDAIIKTPSNDPLTAVALARTMIDLDPAHPITRHLSVAYWKGGDERVEDTLYDPRHVEKIVAWGGFASVKHITRYLQPGIDLITLDPKHSATIIGEDAFQDEETLQAVADRLALDVGRLNQEACNNARVIYVECGTDGAGLAKARRLGELAFASMQKLPSELSTAHKDFDRRLKEEIDALRMSGTDFTVFGGRANEGAFIISPSDEPVDFATMLACRVGNIVPVDDIETAVRFTNAYTQTIGVFPEGLKDALRDRLAFQGAQRIVSLGAAIPLMGRSGPQDGIEPVRRMCKWITDETSDNDILVSIARSAPLEGAGA